MIRMTVLCVLFLFIKDGTCGSGSNSNLDQGRFGPERMLNELTAIKGLLVEIKEQGGMITTKLQPTQTPNDTKQEVTEVAELPVCDPEISLPDTIDDEDITASSFKNGYDAYKCRFSNLGFWQPEDTQEQAYIQFKFFGPVTFTSISTKGLDDVSDFYVTLYAVAYSTNADCSSFMHIPQNFTGNTDGVSIVNNTFTNPFTARCVRVIPLTYYEYIVMKIGLFGCYN